MTERSSIPSVTDIVKAMKEKGLSDERSEAVLTTAAKRIQKTFALSGKLEFLDFLPERKRPVINGTGILLHTNLGRAPLGQAVLARLNENLTGYTNLEMNLEKGERGGRTAYLDALFESLTEHYKPVWVNNNAAGVLLSLNTIKKMTGLSRVIVSRGELVEIGGGFRVPEIMSDSGFELVEVGTTNKTRLADFEEALQKGPAAVCRVHPSNFVIQGFVESVPPEDLIGLCKTYGAPLIYDAGTLDAEELRHLREGFDLVTLSTDKTLGGAQGGLIAAKPEIQKALLKNPFYRALRLDKMSLLALEVAFEAHADRHDRKTLPLREMLYTDPEVLRERATRIKNEIQGTAFTLEIVSCEASLGGGTWPGETRKSFGLAIQSKMQENQIAQILRRGRPSLVISIVDGKPVINLASVPKDQLPAIATALRGLDWTLSESDLPNRP